MYVILVFVASVTVRVHLVWFKLIANKTRTLASTQIILQMGPQIWNDVPQDLYMHNSLFIIYARFSSRLKRSTLEGSGDKSRIGPYYIIIICDDYLFNYWDRYGGGGTGQHRRCNGVRIYIYILLFLSLSCRMASIFIISKYIQLLFFLKLLFTLYSLTDSFLHLWIVCHIMELSIYAFKFQFNVNI